MIVHWPQVTFFVLQGLIVILTAAVHGDQRTDRWNVLIPLGNAAFNTWLLWAGGFFNGCAP